MFAPSVSYYFEVSFSKTKHTKSEGDMFFSEVSGLEIEIETITIKEGGNNSSVIQLPGRTTYKDITLKRAMLAESSPLYSWFQEVLTGNFIKKIEPLQIFIKLLNEEGDTKASWTVSSAYPKKISVSDLNASASGESAIMIDTLTLAHSGFVKD